MNTHMELVLSRRLFLYGGTSKTLLIPKTKAESGLWRSIIQKLYHNLEARKKYSLTDTAETQELLSLCLSDVQARHPQTRAFRQLPKGEQNANMSLGTRKKKEAGEIIKSMTDSYFRENR